MMTDENENVETETPEQPSDEALEAGTDGDAEEGEELDALGASTEEEVPTAKQAIYRASDELDLETVFDIPVEIKVVLGQTKMSISDLLRMGSGDVIELEKKVGEPVDVYVNKRLVARGEVVIVEDHIGITMTEIIKVDKNKD